MAQTFKYYKHKGMIASYSYNVVDDSLQGWTYWLLMCKVHRYTHFSFFSY